MSEQRRPRRPAMLDPAVAESIEGDEDPATRSELAHTTAHALVEGGRRDSGADPDLLERLVTLVDSEGLDTIAELWSHSPATTLPGALWRLYLLREWVRRDPATVSARYREGLARAEVAGAVAGVAAPSGPDDVVGVVDKVLSGVYAGDLAVALDRAAAFLRVLATGSAMHADYEESDGDGTDLAFEITRRAGGLLTTAEELEAAATLHGSGQLD
ncbi:MAG: hypothetical protein ACTHXO_04340 [Actinomycetaceae bacterium]